ncbi:MAG: hypothetical protein GKR77_03410 [Legionellales bacterium]|nr:hypothetical protein [Legionellales bacterium]
MHFPPHLSTGDPIALVTSSHLITEEKLQTAVHNVQSLGLEVAYTPPLRRYGYYAGTIAERVAELNDLFRSQEVRAIFFVRGGSGAASLLPELDYPALQARPKLLMGLSDVTAILHTVTQMTNLITYHGPVASMQWSMSTRKQLHDLLFHPPQTYDFTLGQHWQTVLPGQVQGQLWGGNLTVFTGLLGTPFLQRDWQHTILFLEDIGEEHYRLDRMLSQLELAGILPQLAGLLLGNFNHSTNSSLGQFTLPEIFQRYADKLQLPTLMNAPFGHTIEQLILPIGQQASLDTRLGQLTLT